MVDLAAALTREGVLAPQDVARVVEAARDGDVASAALRLGVASEPALVRALARIHGYPGVDLSRSVVPASNLSALPAVRCRKRGFLPISIGEGELVLAMENPGDEGALQEVWIRTGKRALPHVAIRAAMSRVLHALTREGLAVWRGAAAPALPSPEAAWVGIVRGAAPADAVDLPRIDEKLERVSATEFVPSRRPGIPPAPAGPHPARPASPAAPSGTALQGRAGTPVDAAPGQASGAWRAGVAAMKEGRDDEALALCRRATSDDPRSGEAHYWLGHALSRQGLLFEAVAAFERAAELRPDVSVVHECLALTYERVGFHRPARAEWAHAIESCRDPGRKRTMQAHLEKLRSS